MIPYPNINPEIVRIGPFAVRWYGMMYLIGFASSYFLVRYQIKKLRVKSSELGVKKQQTRQTLNSKLLTLDVDALYSYLILGLLFGARLGYVIFYNLSYYVQHPLEIFAIWHGGMSFHGGLIGSVIAGILFCKKLKIDVWQIADIVIVTAPIGLGLGRLGNFINGELYGRVADVPWAMIFPTGGPLPRHPSQLYEFFLEGVVLFSVLWILKNKGFRTGILSSLFIVFYGAFRFFVEFFREPDPQLGFILGLFTMGQALSALMVIFGLGILYLRKRA
ncbi:MAG: prolipoprotein diacylglyceryl transferase [Nitrospirae bacterium]|nr:prolipoprotein diacylglyceryl transferase [Nitrospirota bacterium]MDA8214962.1 prolipoprotein diacylglyceryl transferase [Nitrospiraceae bacterium]MDA8337886.1 prolipoprotein diacylglyceryl transferase [Nitrospiraceae bacterium]